MSNYNLQRKSCKDSFNAFLVENAYYDGDYEIPVIKPTNQIPNGLVAFSKSLKAQNYNQWVHFFEYDYLFERFWRDPKRYLQRLKKFNGVILPDFSLYRDMPLAMQIWNIYRSRAIGTWLQSNAITVIPNIRFGDERTYEVSCCGISEHCVIAIGAYGNIKNLKNREYFINGLEVVVNRLKPTAIVVYGCASDTILDKYRKQGIEVVSFNSDSEIAHSMEKRCW